jgi:hypothetical protein
MRKIKSILMLVLWLSSGNTLAKVGHQHVDAKEIASLDAEREKNALQVLANLTENVIVSAADAMPADINRQYHCFCVATCDFPA